ncbi:MAG: tRNA/rRNA methyltransferase [Bacteroidetes bacterium]|nr:MAG: tRNA/rRNA methyltransferase [Bacteroidota bacterium]
MRKLSTDELNRISPQDFSEAKKLPVIAVLDDIRSLNNIGSFFRSSDAFSIEALFLCGITACPPHREIQKTALGATETVRWEYFSTVSEALSKLKNEGFTIVCIEQTSESIALWDFKPSLKTAVIFGNEVDGVSEEAVKLCDFAVEIPQSGTKHSLNVAVCGGIVLWHCYKQLANRI